MVRPRLPKENAKRTTAFYVAREVRKEALARPGIHIMTRCTFEVLRDNCELAQKDTEFLMIDNGSDEALEEQEVLGAKIVRLEETIGVYPTFWEAMKHTDADVLAFLHSDVVIWERAWNERVMERFSLSKELGLIGFVGSNEIDENGTGRGSRVAVATRTMKEAASGLLFVPQVIV